LTGYYTLPAAGASLWERRKHVEPIGFDKKRADEIMAARGVDVLVLTSPENVFYTSGLPVRHVEHNPILFVLANQYPTMTVIPRGGQDSVITWVMFDSALTWIKDFCGALTRDGAVEGVISRVGAGGNAKLKVGIESSAPFYLFEALRSAYPNAELVVVDDIMLELRTIKSAEEIRRIREATRIAEKTISALIEHLEDGISDLDLLKLAKIATLNEGGSGTNHLTLSVGDSDPEAPGTGRRIKSGELTRFDTGAMYAGYVSDVCRHACLGEAPAEAVNIVARTVELQQVCVDAIRPGVTAGEVEDVMNREMERIASGMPVFTMGHGVGLNTEESHFLPTGLWGSRDMVFQPGMVFDLEYWALYPPYVNRLIGMEDTYLVTETGCDRLSTLDQKIFSR
jgi:Xaa-Pro aminopeptidase